MEITTREATIKDLERLQELNIKLFIKEQKEFDSTLDIGWSKSAKGKKFYQEMILTDKKKALVAEHAGVIIGYLVGEVKEGSELRKPATIAEAEDAYVLEEFRSKGIGKRLFEEFETWCKEKGAELIKITVTSKNERAIELYHSIGYEDHVIELEKEI